MNTNGKVNYEDFYVVKTFLCTASAICGTKIEPQGLSDHTDLPCEFLTSLLMPIW
jgi:hypothetical protein